MSDIRPWAVKRRALFFSLYGIFFALVVVGAYTSYVYTPATCFDNARNGAESGVDCGGNCVRICAADVEPPRVVWVNSFEVQPGQYNTVAYLENPNQFAGAENVSYTITLKNGDTVVAERSGITELPPNTIYPIFAGRVFTDGGAPITETLISVEAPEVWQPATVRSDQLQTRDFEISNADVRPRLDVTLENITIDELRDVAVVATIFNAAGEPVTASETVIDIFPGEATEDIVFTWPNPIAKTVRSCIVPTDVALAIDLSGSMNNDGENPPQPLTSALQAASSFADNLAATDNLSIVTFASNAFLEQPLTAVTSAVTDRILGLSIAPESEAGFTNTLAGLEVAARELNSDNHNPDARRVLVILTDGLPTDPDDERDILTETETFADELDLSGIRLYAIGLGQGVDQGFIRNLASGNDQAFFAPTGADLETIYSTITSDLCESGPTRVDIIAKPRATFEPLR